jgi:hypothetical protein
MFFTKGYIYFFSRIPYFAANKERLLIITLK